MTHLRVNTLLQILSDCNMGNYIVYWYKRGVI